MQSVTSLEKVLELPSTPPPSITEKAEKKPLMRGVLHQIAFFVAFITTAVLVATARSTRGAACAMAFGASLVILFGVSSLYHRLSWSDAARQRMRRLDHSAIFILIAGGYTPLFALVPSSKGDHLALLMVWCGAALGVTKSMVWPRSPKWVTALLCVVVGWMVIGQVIDRSIAVGPITNWILAASGATYSLGALVYATKRPNPYPRVFGYHEVFHALTIVASVLLVTHVALVLRHG
jgi:hemolysin III